MWETLNNIEGDSHFVDADFRTKVNDDVTPQTGALNVDAGNQIDTEWVLPFTAKHFLNNQLNINGLHFFSYLIALQLQEQAGQSQPSTPRVPVFDQSAVPLTEYAVARRYLSWSYQQLLSTMFVFLSMQPSTRHAAPTRGRPSSVRNVATTRTPTVATTTTCTATTTTVTLAATAAQYVTVTWSTRRVEKEQKRSYFLSRQWVAALMLKKSHFVSFQCVILWRGDVLATLGHVRCDERNRYDDCRMHSTTAAAATSSEFVSETNFCDDIHSPSIVNSMYAATHFELDWSVFPYWLYNHTI